MGIIFSSKMKFIPMMLLTVLTASFFMSVTAQYGYFNHPLRPLDNNPVSGLSLDEATVVMKYHNPSNSPNPDKMVSGINNPGLNYISNFLKDPTQIFSKIFSNAAGTTNPSYGVEFLTYAKEFGTESAPTDLSFRPLDNMAVMPKSVFKREISPNSMEFRQKRSPQQGVMQNTNPVMMQATNPAMMQGMNPAMMQATNPATMQGMNPAMMQGISPYMMQGISPYMMQGINPYMMQSINPALMQSMMMQSPNPLMGSRPQIVFVPMMMASSPTRMGKREAPNEEISKRRKRSPLTYQLVPMSVGMQSASPMMLQSPSFPFMQSASPMQPSAMMYMMPMASTMRMKKRSAPSLEMMSRHKRSPLTYQLVPMSVGMQSASPMMLQSPNFPFMQSASPMQPSAMMYMMPMASTMRMKKRSAPSLEMMSRQKRSPLTYQLVPMSVGMQSASPMFLQNPNYPFMQSASPMQSSGMFYMVPHMGMGKREAPNPDVPGEK